MSRGSNRWVRLLAAALALLACADLTLDAACDPIHPPAPRTSASLRADSGAPGEAATLCVADCYCCARSDTPRAAAHLPPPPAVAEPHPAPSKALVTFVRAVPDPPPPAFS